MVALNINILDDGPIKEMLSLEKQASRSKEHRRFYPSSRNLPSPIESPLMQKKKIPLHPPDSLENPSYTKLLALFVQKLEEIQKIGLDIIENAIYANQKHIQETFQKSLEKEHEIENAENKNKTWEKVASVAGGIGGITALCIGATLISGGAALPIIAGIGLIFSGLASISGAIFEMAGISNNVTTGVQMAGGIIGLLAGGASFVASAAKLPLAIKIGSGLISVAGHSANAASCLYKQQSLKHQAISTELESSLTLDRDDLKSTAKLLKHITEAYLDTTINLIAALKREEDILRNMVKIQSIRG